MSPETVNAFTLDKLERAGVHVLLFLIDLILQLSAAA